MRRADPRVALASLLARAAAAPAWRSFERALRFPATAQAAVLSRIVDAMGRTKYGAHWGLTSRDGYRSFAKKFPIVDYRALSPWIEEQKATEGRVLCAERVLFYEQTSGSSGAAKWIPYTPSLKRSFSRTFTLWLRDLLASGPRLETGRTWLSVSPFVAKRTETERGVPVGLEHDSDYIGGWLGGLLAPFWVVPACVRGISDAGAFRDAVATRLLAADDLELISLWSPTMLTSFLEHIVRRRENLLASLPPYRARVLCALLAGGDAESVDWQAVWPRLKLLSCWDQGSARAAAEDVRRLLPGVLVQGKGHLATEAPVTIPLISAGFAPVLDEVFFEFEEPSGAIRLLHELEEGREYALILSQLGGFCRYRLGDRVRAGKRIRATPSLELAGRADPVCDLVGEKLHADFAAEALAAAAPESRFRLMIPVAADRSRRASYLAVADRAPADFAQATEDHLRRSPQYRQAVDMGQLAPLSACVRPDARSIVEERQIAAGRIWGAIKPTSLILSPAEGSRLAERLLEACEL